MFEKLFFRAATIAAYRSAPLFEERLRYLSHSEQCGAPRYTLRAIAANQLNLVAILNLTADRQVSRDEIEWAAQQWAKPRPHRCGRAASKKAIAAFVNHATRWMSFIGWLDQPEKPGPRSALRDRHLRKMDAARARIVGAYDSRQHWRDQPVFRLS